MSRIGQVVGIYISHGAGGYMHTLESVQAIAGLGLEGDRYCSGEGSYNKGKPGRRQVSIMNARFFNGSGFAFSESRRNLFFENIELMWLIGREFPVGAARLRGVKYCEPCMRPSKLAGRAQRFEDVFLDCGGIIAEVLESGLIRLQDKVVQPPREY